MRDFDKTHGPFYSFKMGVQNLEITFQGDKPNLVFNGGSTIVGTVRFTVDEEPKDTRGGHWAVTFFILKFECHVII